ncbi:MAG TPA: hypothetical protein VGM25_06450 [Caulobacteraceae bacterium]|jgi:hypothetical protein
MTNWRERRLGARPRPRSKDATEPGQTSPPAAAPLVIAIALRQSAQTHADEALKALVELVRTASSEHVRVAAANAILDRALGKPLPGAKAAEDAACEEDGEDGPLVVRWLDPEKS